PVLVTLKSGVKRDGSIVARESRVIFNSGAYGSFKPVPDGVLNGSDHTGGPYDIPNLRMEAFSVYTNNPPCGYMRGPGHPQVAFSVEAHMDLLARELGMDALEFRRKNVVRQDAEGEAMAPKTLDTAAQAIGWGTPKVTSAPSKRVGRGLAMATRHTGIGEGTSDVTLNPDGTVTVLSGLPDNGTGSLTVVVQVVAQEMGVPVERVRLVRADTDQLPTDSGSGASRVTNVAGHAAIAACSQLKEQLAPRAAAMLGVDSVKWDGIGWAAEGARRVALEDLAVEMVKPGDPDAHVQVILAQKASPDKGYCTQAVEVEVDVETGEVRVRKIVTVQDTGTIINPLGHQSQIDGGVSQGFGLALTEELLLEDGRVTNAHLSDYKIPSIADMPELETIHLYSEGPGPYNARAIGEMPYVPIAGAITNAVADAIGTPIMEIPITAERVLQGLEGRE
ncbi:MAG: hypothetical protein HW416_3105, partial [Chloroflexi bacterium]|nr:hypothetical protein [Chloroflexota bacterium]